MKTYGIVGVVFVYGLSAQVLTIAPPSVLVDQSAVIRVTGLNSNERVTIAADLVDGGQQGWQSKGEFVADSAGVIDLSIQAPVKGSYKVVSAMGLVWAMTPATRGVNVYRAPHEGAQRIRFQLLRNGRIVSTAELEQRAMAEGVREVNVSGQLHGILFLPPGSGPCPGVLVVGGSEGGVPRQRAEWLASHGFAAFALAYFRYENLPPRLEAIPLEYFGQALAWMMKRPEIAPDRIGVLGGSRGGELALQLASMYTPVKAVVAYVPANARHRACCGENAVPWSWTWHGSPLAYSERLNTGPQEIEAAIRVEQIRGPILLIAGGDDRVWDSPAMVRTIVARLKQAHFANSVESLIYPHAGHGAGRPEIVPEWHGALRHPVSGRLTELGGTPEGNALSSIDAIPKVLDFLGTSLGSRVQSK